MAEEIIELVPITDRRQVPYRKIRKIVTGADIVRWRPKLLYEVPSVFGLVSLSIVCVTDATVANRYVVIAQAINTNSASRLISNAITASQNLICMVSPMDGFTNLSPYADKYAGINNLEAFTLSDNDQLTIEFTNGVAGDSFDIRACWKFRNWELGMLDPVRLCPPVVRGC